MKNKAITIFLLISVLFIWSWVVYKFYYGIKSNNDFSIAKSVYTETIDTTSDFSFFLHQYTRDPFLSIIEDTASFVEEVKPISEIKKIIKPVDKSARDLPVYCGTIQNDEKKKIAIVKYNGKYLFVSEREKFDSYSVFKITYEQLIIVDNSKEKIILSLIKEKTNKQQNNLYTTQKDE